MKNKKIFLLLMFLTTIISLSFVFAKNFSDYFQINTRAFLKLPFATQKPLIQGWYYNNGLYHGGVDFKCQPGEKIYAPTTGYAMSSKQIDAKYPNYSYGNFVLIYNKNGYSVLLAHLDKINPKIKHLPANQRWNKDYLNWTLVKPGDFVGYCGQSGTTNYHLHFEVNKGFYVEHRVDPYDIYSLAKNYPNLNNYKEVGKNYLWLDNPPQPLSVVYFSEDIFDKKQLTNIKGSKIQKNDSKIKIRTIVKKTTTSQENKKNKTINNKQNIKLKNNKQEKNNNQNKIELKESKDNKKQTQSENNNNNFVKPKQTKVFLPIIFSNHSSDDKQNSKLEIVVDNNLNGQNINNSEQQDINESNNQTSDQIETNNNQNQQINNEEANNQTEGFNNTNQSYQEDLENNNQIEENNSESNDNNQTENNSENNNNQINSNPDSINQTNNQTNFNINNTENTEQQSNQTQDNQTNVDTQTELASDEFDSTQNNNTTNNDNNTDNDNLNNNPEQQDGNDNDSNNQTSDQIETNNNQNQQIDSDNNNQTTEEQVEENNSESNDNNQTENNSENNNNQTNNKPNNTNQTDEQTDLNSNNNTDNNPNQQTDLNNNQNEENVNTGQDTSISESEDNNLNNTIENEVDNISNQDAISTSTIKNELNLEVVISEIAWAGLGSNRRYQCYNREWLELYNNTNQDIDLNGWSLKIKDKNKELKLNLTGLIKKHSYFLIAKSETDLSNIKIDLIIKDLQLANSGANLYLYDQQNNLIDKTEQINGWLAGNNNLYQSAFRVNLKADGNRQDNWQSSLNASFSVDSEHCQTVYGSPGMANDTYWVLDSLSNRFTSSTIVLEPKHNPYIWRDVLEIPEDKTLIIKPGVIFLAVSNRAKIIVNGKLKVQGTEQQPVYFTIFNDQDVAVNYINQYNLKSLDSTVNWQKFVISGQAEINYTVFKQGGYKDKYQSTCYNCLANQVIELVDNGQLKISNAKFINTLYNQTNTKQNYNSVIYLKSGQAVLNNNDFETGYIAIKSEKQVDLSLINNKFSNFSFKLGTVDLKNFPLVSNINNKFNDNEFNGFYLNSWQVNGEQILPADYLYNVQSINISPSSSLKILAGVKLNLGINGNIMVNEGKLLVNGTAEKPVLITSQDDNSMWGTLVFNKAVGIMNYVKLTKGGKHVSRSESESYKRSMLLAKDSILNFNHVHLFNGYRPNYCLAYLQNSQVIWRDSDLGWTIPYNKKNSWKDTAIKIENTTITLDNIHFNMLDYALYDIGGSSLYVENFSLANFKQMSNTVLTWWYPSNLLDIIDNN